MAAKSFVGKIEGSVLDEGGRDSIRRATEARMKELKRHVEYLNVTAEYADNTERTVAASAPLMK